MAYLHGKNEGRAAKARYLRTKWPRRPTSSELGGNKKKEISSASQQSARRPPGAPHGALCELIKQTLVLAELSSQKWLIYAGKRGSRSESIIFAYELHPVPKGRTPGGTPGAPRRDRRSPKEGPRSTQEHPKWAHRLVTRKSVVLSRFLRGKS